MSDTRGGGLLLRSEVRGFGAVANQCGLRLHAVLVERVSRQGQALKRAKPANKQWLAGFAICMSELLRRYSFSMVAVFRRAVTNSTMLLFTFWFFRYSLIFSLTSSSGVAFPSFFSVTLMMW